MLSHRSAQKKAWVVHVGFLCVDDRDRTWYLWNDDEDAGTGFQFLLMVVSNET